MVGTIFGLGLSQQIGSDGKPLAGWKLSLYEANTSTPVTAYKDFGLTAGQEHPHPIEADANGRMPQFWLADGSYRAKGTDAGAAITLFDEDEVQALGPSSGEGGGGGGVDADAILKTGDFFWSPKSGTRSGCVRANGRTIGSSTSGASERANADCEDLYTDLWNNYSDTLCPVTGGRGANAAADWAANKPIATLNMRGIGATGLADMGNSDSGILDNVTFSVGNKTTAASLCGSARKTLVTANLPAYTPSGSISQVQLQWDGPTSRGALAVTSDGTPATIFWTGNTPTNTTAVTPTFTGAAQGGTSTAFDIMQPSRTGTWYIKL